MGCKLSKSRGLAYAEAPFSSSSEVRDAVKRELHAVSARTRSTQGQKLENHDELAAVRH